VVRSIRAQYGYITGKLLRARRLHKHMWAVLYSGLLPPDASATAEVPDFDSAYVARREAREKMCLRHMLSRMCVCVDGAMACAQAERADSQRRAG
jgi:hypothetical protein